MKSIPKSEIINILIVKLLNRLNEEILILIKLGNKTTDTNKRTKY